MSFQNRCIIPTANGAVQLSVPLQGGRENNLPLAQVRIDNSQRWQTRHWRTITAAYNRSPFFEFYAPGLEMLFGKEYELLHQWNLDCLRWLLNQFGLSVSVELLTETGEGKAVPRIMPRDHADPRHLEGLPVYHQVFQERIGFMPNMSSIDLLFCEGPKVASLFNT